MKPVDRPVKTCPMCGQVLTIQDIASTPAIRPIGMSFDEKMEFNLIYFQHEVEGCGTCFTIPVLDLADLIDEPIPAEALTGTAHCERHCERVNDLSVCRQECRYAPFRRLLISLIRRRAAQTAATR